MFITFNNLCYEIAILSLPRVTFSEVPGLQGVVINSTPDEAVPKNVLVHWGKLHNKYPFVQTWHPIEELTFVDRGIDRVAQEIQSL